jgi:hypothetical protein
MISFFGTLDLIPCTRLALVVGQGLGSAAALLNALAIKSITLTDGWTHHLDVLMTCILFWSLLMGFLLFHVLPCYSTVSGSNQPHITTSIPKTHAYWR